MSAISACSSATWYHNSQQAAIQQCEEQNPGAREACLARLYPEDFSRYERERRALHKKSSTTP